MPTRSRKAPAALTRSRARRTEEPDVLGSNPADTAASPAKTPTKAKAGTGRASGKSDNADTAPAKTPRRQQSIYFDVDVLDRARAAVTHLAAYQPDAGIRSLSDLINPALAAAVDDLEQKFNNGEPFRQVARMRTGRPAGT